MNNNGNKNPFGLDKHKGLTSLATWANEWIDSFYKWKNEVDEVKHIADNINEINTVDLSTYDGYTEYMKRLGDVRNKLKDYDELVKRATGTTVTEILDGIAKQATDYYLENNKDKDIKISDKANTKIVDNEEKTKCDACDCNRNSNISNDIINISNDIINNSDTKRVVNDNSEALDDTDVKQKTPNKCKAYAKMPSDGVSNTEMTRLNRIVNRYFNESLLPWYEQYGVLTNDEADWLHNEILEFACWLKKN